ncbi:MAG: PEP-CTERM sorting domain-containing protein [Acetobacteraceae bacterium]
MIGKHAAFLGMAIACAWSAPALAGFSATAAGDGAFPYDIVGTTKAAGSSPGAFIGPTLNFGPVSSSADLATGQLHTYAHGGTDVPFNLANEIIATANFVDTLHIVGPIDGIVMGSISVHIDGTLIDDPNVVAFNSKNGAHLIAADAQFNFGVFTSNLVPLEGEQLSVSLASGPTGSCPSSNFASSIHVVYVCATGAGAYSYDLSMPFDLSDRARDVLIEAEGGVSTIGSGVADFGHTASLGLTLPDGLTYTSDSGVFLSERPSAVPEPTTFGLLAAAIGLLGAATRSRGRQVAS